jgi:hypothetical protein
MSAYTSCAGNDKEGYSLQALKINVAVQGTTSLQALKINVVFREQQIDCKH